MPPIWVVILTALLGPTGLVAVVIGVNEIRYRRNKRRHEAGLPHNCLEGRRLRKGDDLLMMNWKVIADDFAA